jgi:nicotinamide mononucleotide (NMN) deamidase PncC
VAGPDEQEGQPPGTVFFALALGDGPVEAVGTQLPGQREMVRQFATISLLNLLRMKLASMG